LKAPSVPTTSKENIKHTSFWRSLLSSMIRTRSSRAGVIIVCVYLSFVIVAALATPYAPKVVSGRPNSPPTLAHPFGTDYVGHDILSQVAWGSFPSLFVGLSAAVGAALIGFFVGLLTGYYEKLGSVLSASTDIILSFPALVLLIIVGALFTANNQLLIASLAVIIWAPCARGITAQVRSLKKRPFVDAARTSGMSDGQILFRVIAPKVGPIGMAYFVLNVSLAIVIVTALEFLGVGNPNIVSWGSVLYFAQQYGLYLGDWWWVLAPGLSITLVAIGFALIGFSFEEIMNPRLRV
jgi:peptide/nickel transport system permease protein